MKYIIYTLTIFLSIQTAALAQTIYVTTNGNDNNDGLSWNTAFATLQKARQVAANTQIWVAAGTYYPDEGGGQTDNDRNASFVMKNNVAIYGGFAGNELATFDLNQRNLVANETILSGDIDQDNTLNGNSYNVVRNLVNGVNYTAILDGFTISGGNANVNSAANTNNGGGMFNAGTSPLILNCRFEGNYASQRGGGTLNWHGYPPLTAHPIFINCLWTGNSAAIGGAIIGFGEAHQTFINCTIEGNYRGAAISCIEQSQTTLINCIVWNNKRGGSIGTANANVSIGTNATFSATYSLIQRHNPAGTGNLDGTDANNHPQFEQETDFSDASVIADLRLKICSPVLNVGSNADNTNLLDIAGNARIYNSGTIDLGAYELQSAAISFPTPTLTTSAINNPICAGQSVTFTTSGGTNYEFFVNNMSVQNGASNTYTTNSLANGNIVKVEVTNSEGCLKTTNEITITVNALPTITFTSDDADNTICQGDEVTFTAGGGVLYEFFVNGISMQNGSATTFTTNGLSDGDAVTVKVTNASGCSAFSAPITMSVSTFPMVSNFSSTQVIDASSDGAVSVYSADIDGDGDMDVLGAAFLADEIAWWENDGAGVFTKQVIAASFDGARSVYSADIDGDGDMDVLGAGADNIANEIAWWENDGTENFTKHLIDASFSYATSVYSADIDGDGDMDVLGAAANINQIAWWENDGTENFTKHTIATGFSGAWSIYSTDIDGDGDMDVLGAAINANQIAWWENDGTGVFTKHVIDGSFNGAWSVYSTDIDGDGDMDVLGAAAFANQIAWWENDGSGVFTKHVIDGSFNRASSVYASDIDGDGDMDVLGAARDANEIVWWENDGSGVFTKQVIDGSFNRAESVYAADIDGDGDMDVLGAAFNADEIAWWENDLSPTPLTSTDADNSICVGESVAFSYSGGTNYDFFVNDVSVQSGPSDSYTTSTLADGDRVKVTVSNANGCMQTSPETVMTVISVTATAAATNATCQAGTSTANNDGKITITGFAASDTYQYSTGVTFNANVAIPASPTTIPAGGVIVNTLANANQSYTVRITNANGCSIDRVVSTTAVSCTCTNPVLAAISDQSICVGETFATVQTSVTNGVSVTYQWYNDNGVNNANTNAISGQTTATLTALPTAAGSYAYRVEATRTDDASCKSSQTVMLVINGLPTATAAATNATCQAGTSIANNNGKITITGFAVSDQYQYSTGITFNANVAVPATATTIPAGGVIVNTLANANQSYTVRITNANGCFIDRVVSITAVGCTCTNPVLAAISDQSICVGETFATVQTSVTNGVSVIYQWYNNNGSNNPTTNAISGQTTATLTALPTATGSYAYRVEATRTDDASCKSSQTVMLVINALPTATAAATNATCQAGTSIANNNGKITITGFAVSDQYQYSTGITFNANVAVPATATTIPAGGVIVNTLANANQSYTVRITNANGCFIDRVVSITAVGCTCTNPVLAAISDQTICVGETSATVQTSVTNGVSVTYQWYNDNGVNNANTNAISGQTTATLTALPTATGSYAYRVEATRTDDASCKSSQTVMLLVNALPTITFTSSDADNTICEGDEITFTASGGIYYEFFVNNMTVQNSSDNTYTSSTLADGAAVKVRVENGNNCSKTSSAIAVTVGDNEKPVPQIANLPTVTSQCSATVTAPQADDNCVGVITATTTDPLSYNEQGEYTITWTYDDGNGNTETQLQTVIIQDLEAPSIDCPANLSVNNVNGQCGAIVNYIVPEGLDNCVNSTTMLMTGLASGDFFPVGTTTVTYQVMDVAQHSASCDFTVTVHDTETPILSDCVEQYISMNAENCKVMIPYFQEFATVIDNCSESAQFMFSQIPSAHEMLLPIGKHQVILSATDPSNNNATCTFDLNVCPPSSLIITNEEMDEVAGGDYSSIRDLLAGCIEVNYVMSHLEVIGQIGERDAFLDLVFDIENSGETMTCIVVASEMSSVLAVQWLNFEAKATPRHTVDLTWQVRTDENVDHYSIERSADGAHFEKVGEVVVSDELIHHTRFYHEDIDPNSGDNYYRILQHQANGLVKVSPIRLVTLKSKDIVLSPNPTNHRFQLLLPEASTSERTFQIFGIDGRLLHEGRLAAEQQRFEWSARDLGMNNAGLYFMKIQMMQGQVLVLRLSVVD